MNQKWNEMATLKKILFVLRQSAAFLVIVFGIFQITNVWADANHVAIPLVGVVFLLQAIAEWDVSRRRFLIDIIFFLLIFACSFAVWFVK